MSRFMKKLKKGLDTLIAPAEDPRETYLNTFDRQRALLVRVQQALVEIGKAKERLEAKAAEVRAKLPEFEEAARCALQTGREDMARLSLQRYQLVKSELTQLEGQLREIELEETRLWLTEQRLSNQIEAFYTRLEFAAARYSAAEAQVQIGEAMTGVSEELAELGRAMEQVERKSEHMQARAAAIDELVEYNILETPLPAGRAAWDLAPPGLEGDIDAHLALLKQEMAAEQLPDET
jgi:phage shock protein A